MQPTGEPMPALRGKDATFVIPPHRLRHRAPNALRSLPRACRARTCGPVPWAGPAPVSDLAGAAAQARRPGLADDRPQPRRRGPQRRGLWAPKSEPLVWTSHAAVVRRLPQAAFNGFLAIKSMRLFALRTVSIGKPAGAPDVSMRWRWPPAAGQAGRRSCGRAGANPDESVRRSLVGWRTSARPSAVDVGRKGDGWL